MLIESRGRSTLQKRELQRFVRCDTYCTKRKARNVHGYLTMGISVEFMGLLARYFDA